MAISHVRFPAPAQIRTAIRPARSAGRKTAKRARDRRRRLDPPHRPDRAVRSSRSLFMFVSSLKPDPQIFGDLSSIAAFLPVGNISLDNYAASSTGCRPPGS